MTDCLFRPNPGWRPGRYVQQLLSAPFEGGVVFRTRRFEEPLGVRRRCGQERQRREQEEWIRIAGNAAEARQRLAGLAFDLLIVDVMMPGEDGMTLVKSLRETLDVPPQRLTRVAHQHDAGGVARMNTCELRLLDKEYALN